MDRREFLRRAALIAAGTVAVDQLDLLDRLGWVRRFFPGWSAPTSHSIALTSSDWDALLRKVYCDAVIPALALETPLIHKLSPNVYREWKLDVYRA